MPQTKESLNVFGPEKPLITRPLPVNERSKKIKELIKEGLGDGSIAVRLNNLGFSCNRRDVLAVRLGVKYMGIDDGGYEEQGWNVVSIR